MSEAIIRQNSDFLFGFEATMTNPNGDPDQENRPRMDYETSTALVSDARRKRDCRDFLKRKGYQIFVDTLAEHKVPMDQMFLQVVGEWLSDDRRVLQLFKDIPQLKDKWESLFGEVAGGFREKYTSARSDSKVNKKTEFLDFNNVLLTAIIQRVLIDIRLFGSAMAVEGVSRTYTGPVQITWGYSLHPVEMVKSNTITSIMNEGNSTFGKKHKLHYALIAHYGTINKYSARLTGMTEMDRDLFRKALVQGMMNNQTDSKQGQIPLFYLEVMYNPDFDGYLGDLRRFLRVHYAEDAPIRSLHDLTVDFAPLSEVLAKMKQDGYIHKVVGWVHPTVKLSSLRNLPELGETVDLWAPLAPAGEGR
ncbi:MAG TPA: type I CRISPR-associated protein Cas7 [Alicyclobacillus sp.]|nr:type I CRISPR-associated protein Cas7 [Alicyclobacillus sp.]